MSTRKKVKSKKHSGKGTLVILAFLLALSGVLHLSDGVGIALARTASPDKQALETAPATALDCPKPPVALAEALSLREEKLSAREAALEDRLAALSLADRAIDLRMAELSAAEEKLKKTLARADGASEADLTRLTEVYQSMKPKEAAALFATMDPEFAAGFLGRMQPEKSAAILSGMTPEEAYTVSVILAGRNAKVPKE